MSVGARVRLFVVVLAVTAALSAGAAEGIAGDKWSSAMCLDVPNNVPTNATWNTANIVAYNPDVHYVTVIDGLVCASGQTPVVAGFLYVANATAPLNFVESQFLIIGSNAYYQSSYGTCIVSPPVAGKRDSSMMVVIGSKSTYNSVDTVETQWTYEKSCTEWRLPDGPLGPPGACVFSAQAGGCKRVQAAVCYDADANEPVDDDYCDPDVRPASVAPSTEPCLSCTEWRLDPWGLCGLWEPASGCTERTQARCYAQGAGEPIADSYCNADLRPAISQACPCWLSTRSPCEITGPSSCTTTQVAVCYIRGTSVADNFCDPFSRPDTLTFACPCIYSPEVAASLDEPTSHIGGGAMSVTTLGAVLGATVVFCALVVVGAVSLARRATTASAEAVTCGERGEGKPADLAL